MTLDELLERCEIKLATPDRLSSCGAFSCGTDDIDEFFSNDVRVYQHKLLTKAYIVVDKKNPLEIITAYTVSNDSIRLTNKLNEEYKEAFLDETDLRDKAIKRFPGVLIGRLGTDTKFIGQGYGSAVMDFIKTHYRYVNDTGCRFLIVDALNNPDTIRYYERNGFRYLVEEETLEAKYAGIGLSHLPLKTRLMYFDLLQLEAES